MATMPKRTIEADYNARRMRHRVALESPQDTKDFHGTRKRFDHIDTVWAEITPRSPTEVVAGERVYGLGTHVCRIRYREDVGSSWRIRDVNRGTVYAIKGIPTDVEQRHRWLDLPLVELEQE